MCRDGFASGSGGLGRGHVPVGSRGAPKRCGGKATTTSSPLVSLFSETAETELPVD